MYSLAMSEKGIHRVLILTAVTLAAFTLTACAPEQPNELDEIRSQGTLVVFGSPDQHNRYMRFMIEEYGEAGLEIVGGRDIDYLTTFAERLGVRLEVKSISRDELPSYSRLFDEFVVREDVHILAGAITVTQKREEKGIVFSKEYMGYEESLLAATGTMTYNSPTDLEGRTAVVMQDSSHQEMLQSFPVVPNFHIASFYAEFPELLLREGFFAPLSTERAKQFIRESPGVYEIVHTFPERMRVAFGLKNEGPLLDELNKFILETQGY